MVIVRKLLNVRRPNMKSSCTTDTFGARITKVCVRAPRRSTIQAEKRPPTRTGALVVPDDFVDLRKVTRASGLFEYSTGADASDDAGVRDEIAFLHEVNACCDRCGGILQRAGDRSGQESNAAGLEFVHGADEFHDAFSRAGLGLRRLENLMHRPSNVGLDRFAQVLLR